MTAQLPLDLPVRPALGREAFLVGPSNEAALRMIERWADWPSGKLALVGPEGSGKTHLAHVWAELSGAQIVGAGDIPAGDALAEGSCLVIEDIDRALPFAPEQETRLFHLHNHILEGAGRLLVTGRTAPTAWGIGLPDLRSRLTAMATVMLDTPDEMLLSGVLVKLFADRQVRVDAPVVSYIARRIDRSIADADRVVDALDKAALAEGREVRRHLAIRVLAQLGLA